MSTVYQTLKPLLPSNYHALPPDVQELYLQTVRELLPTTPVGKIKERALERIRVIRSQDSLLDRSDLAQRLPFRDWAIKYTPIYFPCRSSQFHDWLTGELGTLHERRGTRLDIVAPRGSAKSTWSTFAYPLYCAVHKMEPYTILTSDTGIQAEKYLDSIRAELEGNDLLRRDYPDVCGAGPVWRYDRILLRNGCMIEAVGTGTKLRGRKNRQHRPSLIIADDPQNTGHIISELQRERSWEWLTKDVMNAGNAQTNIVVLGTALHRDCIVLKLQRTAGWTSHLFQSVIHWPDRMDLWAEWEGVCCAWDNQNREEDARAFYEQRKSEMDAGAKVLWPDREPLYDLMALRVSIGHGAFGSEKQGSPINPAACEWPEDLFEVPGFWFERWPEELQAKVLSLDPSKGRDSRRGDYSAYVRLGLGTDNVLYVEADLQRRDTSKMVADGIEHVRQFRPDGFALEANQYQELLAPDFAEAGRAAGVILPIYLVENMVNKAVRIRRLTSYLSQRRIRFKANSPGTALLVQQMKDFPVGDHDDGADSLEQGVRMLGQLLGGEEDEEPTFDTYRT